MTANTTERLRVAVIGAGAIGGLFGARLIQAGHEVVFVARGATLAALHQRGLQITSIDGDVTLPEVQATDDPRTIGAVDVVLVSVKATQVAALAPSLKPLIGANTIVAPMQNGVEAAVQLAAVLGDGHVVDGLARVIVEQTAPAVIRHAAVSPVVEWGPRAATPAGSPARTEVERVAQIFTAAGIKVLIPAQMETASWEKFLFIEPFGLVGAASRSPMGTMRTVPETRALLEACLQEVRAVGAAAGVQLGDDAMTRTWHRYDTIPPESTSSLQRDIMAGRPSEYDGQTGAVLRLAQQFGVPTPVHAALHAAIVPQLAPAAD